MFIAHRGNDNHSYRENSLQAILSSLDQPYISGVECDIRLTLDSQLVLSHNSFVDFEHGFIHTMTLQELLSYRYSNGDKITVLSDLLSFIHTDKIILLELKEEHDRIDEWVKAIDIIKNSFSHLRIYICSFNYALLCELKDKFMSIPMGLIVGNIMNTKKDTSSFDFIMYHYNHFKYTHKESFVWTVNTKSLYTRFKHKVDYIITDKAYGLL